MIQEKAKPPQKILERIRKCLTLGDSSKGATEAEAEAAMSMAKKLMAEYNLEMTDVEFKEQVEAGANESVDSTKRLKKSVWEKRLAKACAILFECQYYYSQRKRDDGRWADRIVFVGVGADASLASEAYTILCKQLRRMGGDAGYINDVKGHTSYCFGVSETLIRRAREIVSDLTPKQEEKCRAMVITKNQVTVKHIKELNLRQARSQDYRGNNEAYLHGRKDGDDVSLNFRKSLA